MAYTPLTVTDAHEGERLDRFLAACMSGLSQRQTRRIWERYQVLVDGRPRAKGTRVRAGQQVSFRPLVAEPDAANLQSDGLDAFLRWPGLRVIARSEQWAAICKPSGLHSAAIAGRHNDSVERFLPRLLPAGNVTLLNRLDRKTSGVVLAGLDGQAAATFRHREDSGEVNKWYLAVVSGRWNKPALLKHAIDQDNRARVRVLDETAGALRYTAVAPIRPGPLPGTTLLLALIKKGARHQIRAHLAHAGHPILGDERYGRGDQKEGGLHTGLYLHCARLQMQGFIATCMPAWKDVQGLSCSESFFAATDVKNAFDVFANLV